MSVRTEIAVRLDIEEITRVLRPEQIHALMNGVGTVMSATQAPSGRRNLAQGGASAADAGTLGNGPKKDQGAA